MRAGTATRIPAYGLAAVGVGAVVVAAMAPVLLGLAAPHWDALDFFAPYHLLIGDYVRSGRLLLWNPFTSFGEPAALDPQVGAFSPVVLAFAAVFGGSRASFEIYWLFVWLLGPLGLLRLARHLQAPAWGAYVAAMSWALSGFNTGHAEHTAWLETMALLPWVLWRLDVAVTGDRVWPAVEAGALWGLSALAGYPGLVLVNAAFAAAWALGRAPRIKTLLPLLVMAVVGAIVLSPTYVAFMVEGRGYSHRAGALSFDIAVANNALHPRALLTLLRPSLSLGEGFEYTDISMRNLYVGLVVLGLAGIALMRRDAFRWFLLIVGLVCLAAAMGVALPVRGWLYWWVLPTRYFRNAALFRIYFMLALTLLALFGAADLQSFIERVSRRHATVLFLRSRPGFTLARLRAVLPVALVALATIDMALTAYSVRSVIYGPPTEAWTQMATRHVADPTLTGRGLAREIDNGNNLTFLPKVPAASGYAPLTGPLVRDYAGDPILLDAATGADRLWFSAAVVESSRSSTCLAALRASAASRGAPPLVIHSRAAMDVSMSVDDRSPCTANIRELPAAQRLTGQAVQVLAYTPERLRLRVRVDEAGWLLVTESWSPGWTAMVNGRAAEVAGGNFLFRAVQVGAGTNSIEFRYRPFGYPWLLAASWGTLALVLLVRLTPDATLTAVRRRRSASGRSAASR